MQKQRLHRTRQVLVAWKKASVCDVLLIHPKKIKFLNSLTNPIILVFPTQIRKNKSTGTLGWSASRRYMKILTVVDKKNRVPLTGRATQL